MQNPQIPSLFLLFSWPIRIFTLNHLNICLQFETTLQVIAESLSEEEIKGLKSMFTNMDTDNSGTITYEELKSGLARLGSRLSEAEVKQLMEAVSYFEKCYRQCQIFKFMPCVGSLPKFGSALQADVDGNGTIDYIEFITATMHRHKLERDEHLYKAFQYFDTDSSG